MAVNRRTDRIAELERRVELLERRFLHLLASHLRLQSRVDPGFPLPSLENPSVNPSVNPSTDSEK